MPHQREDMDHTMTPPGMAAAGGAGEMLLAGEKIGLPADNGGEVAGGVVVVAMGLFPEDGP